MGQETLGGCSQVACAVCPFAVASVQSTYFKKNGKEVLNAQKSLENGQTHAATASYAEDWQTQLVTVRLRHASRQHTVLSIAFEL